MTSFWLATDNTGKISEFKLLLQPQTYSLEIFSQRDLPVFSSPPENGKTYLENAKIKAKALASVKNKNWVMADDSGLEVEGLGGMPGIHSARYAGPNARDNENIAKLLKMIKIRCNTNRKAAFKCTLFCISPNGEEFVYEGVLSGSIAEAPRGQIGFGYDPIFIPDGETKTMSELGYAYKNTNSHRSLACRKLLSDLGNRFS